MAQVVGLAFEIETTVYQDRLGQKVNLGHLSSSILVNLHELSAKKQRAWRVLFLMFTFSQCRLCFAKTVCREQWRKKQGFPAVKRNTKSHLTAKVISITEKHGEKL